MKRLRVILGILVAVGLAVACAQTDAGITTKVKSKLAADDTVKAYQIDVDTKDKVVTLSGNVDNPAAKDQAVAIARGTEGVADVVDNITVGGGSAAMPGEYPAGGELRRPAAKATRRSAATRPTRSRIVRSGR